MNTLDRSITMQLYRIRYRRQQFGTCVEWAASDGLALKALTRLRNEYSEEPGFEIIDMQAVEVPQAKPKFINWLNANLNGS